MFTIQQIDNAHSKVKTGKDFPQYIQDIKKLGVTAFTNWVQEGIVSYQGINEFKIASLKLYSSIIIQSSYNASTFLHQLKIHQQGATDFLTFCSDCANCGVAGWTMDLHQLTCSYFDIHQNIVLVEQIPAIA